MALENTPLTKISYGPQSPYQSQFTGITIFVYRQAIIGGLDDQYLENIKTKSAYIKSWEGDFRGEQDGMDRRGVLHLGGTFEVVLR